MRTTSSITGKERERIPLFGVKRFLFLGNDNCYLGFLASSLPNSEASSNRGLAESREYLLFTEISTKYGAICRTIPHETQESYSR